MFFTGSSGVTSLQNARRVATAFLVALVVFSPGGALGYLLGGYVPPGTPNWHPVLKKIFPKIDTPF